MRTSILADSGRVFKLPVFGGKAVRLLWRVGGMPPVHFGGAGAGRAAKVFDRTKSAGQDVRVAVVTP